jgi:sugar lactone lactonase YvrE
MHLYQSPPLPVEQRTARVTPIYSMLFSVILGSCLLVSCTTTPSQQSTTKGTPVVATPIQNSMTPTRSVTMPATPIPIPAHTTPQRYTRRVLLAGGNRPDDLVFDRAGHLLFSNPHNGTINRLNADGSVTVLLRDIVAPEGLVVLADGTLVIAEQGTNRILTLSPGTSAPKVLRQLPGIPSTALCKDGVDGIAFDATTNTLIIPDSPSGDVYRLSLDGKTLTLLATGIVRPVGAAVDAKGNIYVTDECGGALWRIAPAGQKTRFGNFGMVDDVSIDNNGNILVTDLDPTIHALLRFNPVTGERKTLASQGYIEPQGLVLDQSGDIFVSDDYADIIVEYIPA